MSLKKDPTCKLERQLNELMKDLERKRKIFSGA